MRRVHWKKPAKASALISAPDAVHLDVVLGEKPPVWDSACAVFGILPKGVVFTYGRRVYAPSGAMPPEDVLAHEAVHVRQQEGKDGRAELWWGRYLREPSFRLAQEAEAYIAQAQFLKRTVKDRNQYTRHVYAMARVLSGPLYGSCVDFQGALDLIEGRSLIKPAGSSTEEQGHPKPEVAGSTPARSTK